MTASGRAQALDKLIAKTPLTVPTMWEQGEWDQEDMYGGNHAYRAWEPKDTTNSMNYLVMGPWFHSQVNRQGRGWGRSSGRSIRRSSCARMCWCRSSISI